MATIRKRNLSDWANGFDQLYGHADEKRTPEDCWIATMAQISSIGEAIRKSDYLDLAERIAHSFCWMCCYINKCNKTGSGLFFLSNNFSEIVGIKYPKVCGLCQKPTCVCGAVEMDAVQNKSADYLSLLRLWSKITDFKRYKTSKWITLFNTIYGGRIHLQSIEKIGFHLLEEAGEEAAAVRGLSEFRNIIPQNVPGIDAGLVSRMNNIPDIIHNYQLTLLEIQKEYGLTDPKEALSKVKNNDTSPVILKMRILKSKVDLIIEFADTFSWLCAVVIKYEGILGKLHLSERLRRQYSFENVLQRKYSSSNKDEPISCYICRRTRCGCIFYT